MPSETTHRDPDLDAALRALAGPIERFRSAVARTMDEIRTELESGDADSAPRREPAAALGPLASGRIDPERWAAVLAPPPLLDPGGVWHLKAALHALQQVESGGLDAFRAQVDPGGSLDAVIGAALGHLGRAFGAARTAALIRAGRFRFENHAGLSDHFPPRMWNRAERSIAPPVIARVAGSDLRAGGLATFVDGAQKVLLLVEGPTPPAPLVRLVTPGVLVIQAEEPESVRRIGDLEGPAVAALFPRNSGAALFVHDPLGGDPPAERVTLQHIPEEEALRPVGSWTVDQQREELRQLVALAGAREADSMHADAVDGAEAALPGDLLASWLLRQADLKGLGGGI